MMHCYSNIFEIYAERLMSDHVKCGAVSTAAMWKARELPVLVGKRPGVAALRDIALP